MEVANIHLWLNLEFFYTCIHVLAVPYLSKPVCVLEQEHSSYLVKVGVTVQHGYQTKPEVSEL